MRDLIVQLLILMLSGAVTVAVVRFVMMPGIRGLSLALKFSTKATGQVIGYATSVPELTVLVAAALAGVFDAGFWNIASSNIINSLLFGSAVLLYRQHGELRRHLFRDELAFVVVSVAIPIVLAALGTDLNYPVAGGLLLLFVAYRILDMRLNRVTAAPVAHVMDDGLPLAKPLAPIVSVVCIVLSLLVIVVAGRYLGRSASYLVEQLGVPGWALGWMLGVITSLPELTSFFEVYRLRHAAGILDDTLDDTQEALDALVSSNMCNLTLILPVGTFCYLLVS
jgi:Ca2+/Na+ antiporter